MQTLGSPAAKALVPGSGTQQCQEFLTVAKQQMLGVSAHTLEQHGAVSEAVVREMAEGALANSSANLAIAISGIAGPTGGTAEKPVGLVWMAWAIKEGKVDAESQIFVGDRGQVRAQAVEHVLRGIAARIS